jgi:hypothetical protein
VFIRGGDDVMDKVIKFPDPKIDKYTILHNRATHEVQIPYIPCDRDSAMSILAVFVYSLIENGVLAPEETVQITEQAAGIW